MTHPTASNSREAISGSMINGASIGLFPFVRALGSECAWSPSQGIVGRRSLPLQ